MPRLSLFLLPRRKSLLIRRRGGQHATRDYAERLNLIGSLRVAMVALGECFFSRATEIFASTLPVETTRSALADHGGERCN